MGCIFYNLFYKDQQYKQFSDGLHPLSTCKYSSKWVGTSFDNLLFSIILLYSNENNKDMDIYCHMWLRQSLRTRFEPRTRIQNQLSSLEPSHLHQIFVCFQNNERATKSFKRLRKNITKIFIALISFFKCLLFLNFFLPPRVLRRKVKTNSLTLSSWLSFFGLL